MKPASAKAKGRLFQQYVRDLILKQFPTLERDDVRSTSMGAGGEDLQLSPAARKLFPFSVECKSKASYAFYKDYDQAVANCPEGAEPLLVCRANKRKAVVICDVEWFIERMSK